MKPIYSANPINSIVIRGANWIGDAMMTIPAMRQLSRIFPEADIVLHTRKWAQGIFQDADFLDAMISFDEENKIRTVFQQSQELAQQKFDLAILFPNSFESALTVKMAGIPNRVGYNKDLRGLLLTRPIAVPEWKGRRQEVFYYLNLVAEIERYYLGTDTVSYENPDASLQVSPHRKNSAKLSLERLGIDSTKKTVALGVGSTNSMAKRWGSENYAKLNDALRRELDLNVVLVGAPNEIDVAEEVAALSLQRPKILTGKTSLAEVTATLSVVDMLVSNDMGLAHIAPAVGTKTIVIFGPTNDQTTRPFGENVRVIRHNVECSPCMLRECPIDHRCMSNIKVDEVLRMVESYINQSEEITEP